MITGLCGLYLAGSVAVTRRVSPGLLFNPLVGFFGIWLLNLVFYEFDAFVKFFYVRLSPHAEALLGLSFTSYFIGAVVGMALLGRRTTTRPPEIDERSLGVLGNATLFALAVFTAGVLWKYHASTAAYGPIFGHLSEIRHDVVAGILKQPLLSRAMTLAGYLVVLNLGVLIAFRGGAALSLATLPIALLALLDDATTASRGFTFNVILLLVSTILLASGIRGRPVGLRSLAGAAAALATGLALTAIILHFRSHGSVSYLVGLVRESYLYFVGTVPALSVFSDHPWAISAPGQWTFAPLYLVLDRLGRHLFHVAILQPDAYHTFYAPITHLEAFNSSSYLTYFYSDAGPAGTAILSGAMGLAAGVLFMRAMRLKRVVDIQVAALMMYLVLFSIRGIATNGPMFWITLGLVLGQHVILASGTRARTAEARNELQRPNAAR